MEGKERDETGSEGQQGSMADQDNGFRGKRRGEQQTLAQGGNQRGLPRKRFYRARAHSNPLSDSHFPVYV